MKLHCTLFLFSLLMPLVVAADELKIGGAFALSGGVGGSWGKPELDGATLAVEEINQSGGVSGRKIKFVVEDTQSSIIGTVNAVNKLSQLDQVSLLVGPTWLDSFGGAVPIIEQAKLPTITPSAGPHTLNPKMSLRYTFSLFPSEIGQFRQMFEVAKRLGLKSVVYIFDQDPYWGTFAKLLADEPQPHLTEISRGTFPVGATDYKSWLLKFKREPPDAFIGGFANESSTQAFVKQLKALKLNSKLISVDTLCEFRTHPAFGNTLDGTICVYIADPSNADFNKRFQRRFGRASTAMSGRAYDAVKVLVRAYQLANGEVSKVPEMLRAEEFETVSYGPVRFNKFQGVSSGKFISKTSIGNELKPAI